MKNIHAMGPDEMRRTLLKIKTIVDANGRAMDIVDEIQGMLAENSPLRYDPHPFPDEAPNPRQLKLVI